MADTGLIILSAISGSPILTTSGSGTTWTTGFVAWRVTSSQLSAGQSSRFLEIKNPNPSFPAGAVLTGVYATFDRDLDDGSGAVIKDGSVRLVVGGVATGDNKASGANWGASLVDYGGDGDLWGVPSLAIADILGSGFGLQISAHCQSGSSPDIARVHSVKFRFYYTIAANLPREIIQYS